MFISLIISKFSIEIVFIELEPLVLLSILPSFFGNLKVFGIYNILLTADNSCSEDVMVYANPWAKLSQDFLG